jgi:hypothetical protein
VVAVAAGLAVRVLDGPVLLFVGTVVAGGAIAVGKTSGAARWSNGTSRAAPG